VSGGDRRWFRRSTRKNRPVTRDNKNKIIIIIIIIGIAIPDDSNVNTKGTTNEASTKIWRSKSTGCGK